MHPVRALPHVHAVIAPVGALVVEAAQPAQHGDLVLDVLESLVLPGQMALELGLSLGEAQVLDPDVVSQRRALGEEGVAHFAPVRLDLEVEDGDVVSEVAVVGEPSASTPASILPPPSMRQGEQNVKCRLGYDALQSGV